jgi:hypothetical protein
MLQKAYLKKTCSSYLYITNIWGHFLVKMWVLDPRGTLYSVITCSFVIYLEEILYYFVSYIFLWLFYIIKESKLGRYLHITNIWGHFWSKFGNLTTRGDPILCHHLLFGNLFWRNTIILCPKYIFVAIKYHQRAQMRSYLHITNIWGHFWSKCGYLTPRGAPI